MLGKFINLSIIIQKTIIILDSSIVPGFDLFVFYLIEWNVHNFQAPQIAYQQLDALQNYNHVKILYRHVFSSIYKQNNSKTDQRKLDRLI